MSGFSHMGICDSGVVSLMAMAMGTTVGIGCHMARESKVRRQTKELLEEFKFAVEKHPQAMEVIKEVEELKLKFDKACDKFTFNCKIIQAGSNLSYQLRDYFGLIGFANVVMETLNMTLPELGILQYFRRFSPPTALTRGPEEVIEAAAGAKEKVLEGGLSKASILAGSVVLGINVLCLVADTIDVVQVIKKQPRLAQDLHEIADWLEEKLAAGTKT